MCVNDAFIPWLSTGNETDGKKLAVKLLHRVAQKTWGDGKASFTARYVIDVFEFGFRLFPRLSYKYNCFVINRKTLNNGVLFAQTDRPTDRLSALIIVELSRRITRVHLI